VADNGELHNSESIPFVVLMPRLVAKPQNELLRRTLWVWLDEAIPKWFTARAEKSGVHIGDVVDEVRDEFLKELESGKFGYRGPKPTMGYIKTIAKRSLFRKEKREKRRRHKEKECPRIPDIEKPLSRHPPFERKLSLGEILDAAELSEDEKKVIELRRKGLSLGEITGRQGWSLSRTKRESARAMDKLKKAYREIL